MWQHNFWHWLLVGLRDLSFATLPLQPHQYIGIADLVLTTFVYALIVIVFFVGSFFHLTVFFTVFSTIFVLESIRAGIAAYRWLVTFIPLP